MKFNTKAFLKRLKNKYKLVILNDDTFEEKASFTLSRMNVFALGSAMLIIFIALVMALIIFTPLKEYIPGYADVAMRREMTRLVLKADSLEELQEARERYMQNIRNVLTGRGLQSINDQKGGKPKLIDTISLNKRRPDEDALLRKMIESEGKYELAENESPHSVQNKKSISGYSFFTPIKGVVTEKFNPSIGHYAIDIASKQNESIKVVLDGTVIFAAFTSETGYVIGVQHSNNILSFYKHCSSLLKKVGNFVRAGEVIAVVGNTGELSSGPHLHFELWYNGNPVNPKTYIKF